METQNHIKILYVCIGLLLIVSITFMVQTKQYKNEMNLNVENLTQQIIELPSRIFKLRVDARQPGERYLYDRQNGSDMKIVDNVLNTFIQQFEEDERLEMESEVRNIPGTKSSESVVISERNWIEETETAIINKTEKIVRNSDGRTVVQGVMAVRNKNSTK